MAEPLARSRVAAASPADLGVDIDIGDPAPDQTDIRALLRQPADSSHIVQFYDGDAALVGHVVEFLVAGLRVGEPCIVIARSERRAAIAAALTFRGFAPTPERGVILLDAQTALDEVMVDDLPSGARFRAVVGALIESTLIATPARRLRAYGEMVDLLWSDGRRTAALRLEQLWNELTAQSSFMLLCAYAMDHFIKSSDTGAFRDVCASHSRVIPVPASVTAGGDDRLRTLGELQQRARALAHEVAHRGEVEHALRDALARETALREAAERELRFSDAFSGVLGHDLRNPLGTISMGASYLARGGLTEAQGRTVERIAASAERMARMIDQLLDLTRIRAGGGLELERAQVDLAELCETVRDDLDGDHRSTVAVARRGDTGGVWDRDRLWQVIANVLGNAIAHGTAGGAIHVDIDGSEAGHVVATVHNGGAIDATVLPTLFDPFRGARGKRTRGLGLGLFISQQIAIAHGGQIDVTSSDAAGTSVTIRLPRNGLDASEPAVVRV